MISQSDPVDLKTFVDSLFRAAQAVLRIIQDTGTPRCTGWLITDSLVVVPSFATDPDARYLCQVPDGSDDPRVTRADLVSQTHTELLYPYWPALLRLTEPLPHRALALYYQNPVPAQSALLLHFPRGVLRTKLSLGRVLRVDGQVVAHDAGSEPGSGGAPLLDAGTLRVLGMHLGGSAASDRSNEALSIAAILDGLRESPAWPEIAEHHQLANVSAARLNITSSSIPSVHPAPQRDLLAAAVRWSVDPAADRRGAGQAEGAGR